ncbi:MAG: hypothetical protein ACERKN_00555 [Velocimicrobium sp.]
MQGKKRAILKKIYISIIVPFIMIFLIPVFYDLYLNHTGKRYYYTNQCNWLLIIISIILIISTYFIGIKSKKNLLMPYAIGIGIGIISIIFEQIFESYLYFQIFVQQCILIAGYAILFLFLILSSKYTIMKM